MEHRLSVIENPKRHGMASDKWLGVRAKPSHREEVRLIDKALAKNITLMKDGQKSIRLNSLGEDYTEKELFAVISGVKKVSPGMEEYL